MQQPRSTPEERREVARERVFLLFRKGPFALVATLVNAAILVWFLWGQVPAWWLVAWSVALTTTVAARATLAWAFHRAREARSLRFWEFAFGVGAVASGIAWGIGATAFLHTDLVYTVAVVFIVGGMVAGASTTNATSMPVYAGFTVPLLLPVGIRLVVSGEPLRVVMGATVFVFGVAMTLIAAQSGRALNEAVRLRWRNAVMADRLSLRSRERAERLQALLDHAGVVTIVADPGTGHIVDASRNVEHLFGLTEREVRGRGVHEISRLNSLRSAADWYELVDAARCEEHHRHATSRVADGVRHIETTATIRNVEGTEYALLVLRDVTQQRELEAELAHSNLLASLGTLSAGVAHEVNNPLAYVLGNLRYVRAELSKLDPKSATALKEPIDDAIAGAVRIGRIVHDLAATARPEGNQPLAVDPCKAIETCVRIAENEIRHRATVELDCEPTPAVLAPPLRLNQVLLNLLLNAVAAIPEGQASSQRISIAVRHLAEQQRVAISVRDSGRGIAPELLDRVFEPFFTTGELGRGTGLGLAICHAAVTGLGGSIRVESELGKGSCFTVELPLASAEAQISEPPSSTPLTPPTLHLRLLILDDDRSVARSLARLLSQHEVAVETRADEALARLRADPDYDVVLCDIMMPETTGAQFYELVREFNPALASRIIFVTGGTFTDRTREFLATVPNACLKKPFDISAIEQAIDRVMRQSYEEIHESQGEIA